MSLTLVRASLRYLTRHPWQTGLSILGVALGVAVVVSIDLVNESARRAFRLSAEAVTGRATHQVVGGPDGLDERVYARLRQEAAVTQAAPVVEAYVTLVQAPGRTFQLLGVDPLAEAPVRAYWRGGGPGAVSRLGVLLTDPGAVLLARDTATGLGLQPGAALTLKVAGVRHAARLAGVIAGDDRTSRQALDSLILTDVATAQELTGGLGRLSRIDLVVPDDAARERLLARVARVLPPGAEVVRASARSEFVAQITRAFNVNLGALSLLALIVGLFLVYNAVTFSVVQRRSSIGMLRALGVTRREIFAVLMVEVVLVGVAATALGLGLGAVLARGLLGLVTRTINDLYFVVAVRELTIAPIVLLKSAALGVGATILAALGPALEATGAPPGVVVSRAALEARARRRAPWAALGGVAVLGLGATMLAASTRSLAWGYGGLFALVVGAALLTPAAVVGLGRLAGPAMGGGLGLLGRLAAGGVVRSLSRTAVATAALMIALAATVGVDLMVRSFRQTVVRWLETSLVADVYVSAPGPVGTRAEATLDPGVAGRLIQAPGVDTVGTYRRVRVQSAGGPTQLVALAIGPRSRRQFRFIVGSPARIWPAWETGGVVIVSEPYAYRRGVGVGSTLTLRTDRGEHDFPVAGVFADYGSDQGVVMLSRRTYEAFWDDRGLSSLGFFMAPGADLDAFIATLRGLAGPEQEVLIRSNRVLREASLEIFDRTFAITGVLRLLATVVAVVGILSALMALQIERAREIGVLRAMGLTPAQVWGLVSSETGLMGLMAGVLAVPLGIALALVLIFVINRRSFGWTLEAVIAPGVLVEAVALAVGAALVAGIYPALRLARTAPAAVLREE